MKKYIVNLGYCGSADCSLILSNGQEEYQFGVDTVGWKIIGKYYDHPKSAYIPECVGDYLLAHASELDT